MKYRSTRKNLSSSQRTHTNLVRCECGNTTKQKTIQLFASLIILQMFLLITNDRFARATTGDLHEEEHLRNPLVLNLNTLYEKNRLAVTNRSKRSTAAVAQTATNQQQPLAAQQLVDACQSKVEVITPYSATNSKGKLRSVVNSALMQQAIQVETCVRSQTADRAKCNTQPDCGCEQKYKWHRLLVLDPSDSGASRGLFMDWFLYPSACVCRCRTPVNSSKQFLRTVKRTSESSVSARS